MSKHTTIFWCRDYANQLLNRLPALENKDNCSIQHCFLAYYKITFTLNWKWLFRDLVVWGWCWQALLDGNTMFLLLGLTISRRSWVSLQIKTVKLSKMSHQATIPQYYDQSVNRSLKKSPRKPEDNCLSPCYCTTCGSRSSDDCTSRTEDRPEEEAGFNMRYQISKTIQQRLEPGRYLWCWYRVLSFWSSTYDFYVTQEVK